jgi:predicted ATPase
MVTITGVGGSGKTRLATQVAAQLLPQYPDGAWLCELATATDADVLAQIVAASLGASPHAGMTIEESVLAFLRSRQMLLVFDNCEHLLQPVGRLAESLLRRCPTVRILATSREGLAIDGERVFPLRSLVVPERGADVVTVASTDAVRLFVDRAESARPGFTVDSNNAGDVVDVCRRLDGMPLAIELAAARVAVMQPVEIASLLDERFRLLAGGRRTAVERHQTLRATVDWSYSLLDQRDRCVFERLGVFAGSFDLEAAVDVVTSDDIDRWDVLGAVASLVAKSMLVDEAPVEGSSRYSMLETLRAYALDQLSDLDDVGVWRQRHASCLAARAEDIGRGLQGPDEFAWRRRLHADLDNIRAAVRWGTAASETADIVVALRAIAALAFEVIFTRAAGTGAWATAAIDLTDEAPPGVRTAVLAAAAWDAFNRGDFDASVSLSTAAIDRGVDADCPVPSAAHSVLTITLAMRGQLDRARHLTADAIELLDRLESRGYSYLQFICGAIYSEAQLGDIGTARTYGHDALDIARRLRNPGLLSAALSGFALVQWRDDPEAALAALDESIDPMRSGASDALWATSFSQRALIGARSEPFGALRDLREALVYSHGVGDQVSVVTAAHRAARILDGFGARQVVAVLIGVSDGPFAAMSAAAKQEIEDGNALRPAIRDALGDVEFERALERGAAMSLDEIYEFSAAAVDSLLEGAP